MGDESKNKSNQIHFKDDIGEGNLRFNYPNSNTLSLFDEPTYLGFKLFFHDMNSKEYLPINI